MLIAENRAVNYNELRLSSYWTEQCVSLGMRLQQSNLATSEKWAQNLGSVMWTTLLKKEKPTVVTEIT